MNSADNKESIPPEKKKKKGRKKASSQICQLQKHISSNVCA